jgi:hypothetical protein
LALRGTLRPSHVGVICTTPYATPHLYGGT